VHASLALNREIRHTVWSISRLAAPAAIDEIRQWTSLDCSEFVGCVTLVNARYRIFARKSAYPDRFPETPGEPKAHRYL